MHRVLSLIVPLALLILVAACDNAGNATPTATLPASGSTVDFIPTPTSTPTPRPRPTATNGASGPIPCGLFEETLPDPSWEYHLRLKNSTGVDFDCLTVIFPGNRTDIIDFKDGQITEYRQARYAYEYCVSVFGYVNGERYSVFIIDCLGVPSLPPGSHTYELTLTGETNITGDKDIVVTPMEDISAFNDDECQTNDNVTASATWAYLRETTTVEDMYQFVDVTILGKVVGCSPGRVVRSSSGRFNTHFTNVHIQIVEDWSREALPVDELIVSMTGGEATPYFREAPPFSVGEGYVLFLKKEFISIEARDANEPTPNTYVVVNPNGRYRVEDGTLESLSEIYAVAKELNSTPLQALKREIDTLRDRQ